MDAVWKLERDTYRGDTTLGKLYDHEGAFFCYVLEDVVRPYGIKDKARTAIPATEKDFKYKMSVLPSGRYIEAVTIYTEMQGDRPMLKNGGIEFSYIRCHGGNDADDSEGCLLVNQSRDIKTMKAWGSVREELTENIKGLEKAGYNCYLRVLNLPQTS